MWRNTDVFLRNDFKQLSKLLKAHVLPLTPAKMTDWQSDPYMLFAKRRRDEHSKFAKFIEDEH